MLLVFLMASMIAITLYMELPRVAFEAQRQKEQLLVERGEQYKRAIQVFYVTNKTWPSKVEDLENFNNRRFLRHRYIDPMTGKDEWRIIHIQNGVLTDSVVNKQGSQKTGANEPSYINQVTAIGQNPTGQSAVNMALRRRPNEGAMPALGPDGQPLAGVPGAPGDPGNPGNPPGTGTPGDPGTPGAPGTPGVQTGAVPNPGGVPLPGGAPGAAGNQAGGQIPGAPGAPGQPLPGGAPGVLIPGMPPVRAGTQPQPGSGSGPGAGGSYLGGGGSYLGSTPGIGAGGQPALGAGAPGQQQNAAAGMINDILTRPRGGPPGSLPGFPGVTGNLPPGDPGTSGIQQNPQSGFGPQNQPGQNPQGFGPQNPQNPQQRGQVIGGGMAGVASTADADGIMVYNDRTNYSEWEFIFDPTKYKPPPNPTSGPGNVPPGNQPPTQPPPQNPPRQ
ncbi:MAG: hypothetical protein LAP87_10270 [Acidobacteriia bacterium]|nr:hypothetical protein [Terriglobia bacterium]